MSAVVNPIYRFRLAAGEDERITHAVWADGLSYDCQRESNEMFFRTKLSGNVVFVGKDADWIVGQPFDTRFDVFLERSNDVGNTWFVEWTGFFHINRNCKGYEWGYYHRCICRNANKRNFG